ncbi:radical SAM family heme chaperone HemW [uncultured Succinatimonas sp.]|uniref:radical SAM family heme chaperone HemW n=1 Tax=uncultured Succinatimonas sp. TaxID=1262973 RepID=UPI0025DAAC73|nr:radical SAM family heme chaperone HemW [uncultured Succinatimonas sp.]
MSFDFLKENYTGLYIHYPFCLRKCPYCDFNSYARGRNENQDELYFLRLKEDFSSWMPKVKDRKFISVFIGGGTPSLCAPGLIGDFIDFIAPFLTKDCEITIEANPGTVDINKLKDFKTAGVNRLSLGVQSFNDVLLKRIGRIHDAATAKKACSDADKCGFSAFNIDLMHGLPGQSLEEALSDIKTAAAFNCTHLSWYELTIEEDTYFGTHTPILPSEDELYAIEEKGFPLLNSLGFNRYEVSAFTRDKHCVHNENYWRFGDYVGIGAGSHSKFFDGNKTIRKACPALPSDYLNGDFGKFYTVDETDIPFEYMLNRLRLFNDIKTFEYKLHTGQDFSLVKHVLDKAAALSLIEFKDDETYCVTAYGRQMLNDVLEMFLH